MSRLKLLGLLFLAVNCTPVEDRGVLRKTLYSIPERLSPLIAISTSDLAIANFVFEGLFRLNEQLQLENVLVEDWTLDESARHYTLTLKKNIQLHNGTVLDAKLAVKILEEVVSVKSDSFYKIKNVKKISTLNKQSLVIELEKPDRNFLTILASPNAYLSVPGDKYAYGTGPFKFSSLKKDQELTLNLEAFEDYHRGRPKLAGVEILELNSEKSLKWMFDKKIHDHSHFVSPLLSEAKDLGIREINLASSQTWLLSLNFKNEMVSEFRFRHCLKESIDVQGFVDRFLPDHKVAKNYLPPALFGHGANGVNNKNMSDCSGYKSKTLNITIPVELGDRGKICEYLENKIKFVKIICTSVSFDTLLSNLSTDQYDVSLLSMTLDYPAAEYFLNPFLASSSFRLSNFSSGEIDGFIRDLANSTTKEDRVEILKKFDSYIVNKIIVVNISHPSLITYVDSCLRNFNLNFLGDSFVDYSKVSLGAGCDLK